jgi:hypothetical protein
VSRRVASIHADWLTLVEPSGPFLTLPVLRRVWPNGLDHLNSEARAEVRRHLAALDTDDAGSTTTWLEWVLRDLLAYGQRLAAGPAVPGTLTHVVAEHAMVLRPDYALVEPAKDGATRARMLLTVYPPGTRLDARLPGDRWSATPVERLALLCRATGVEVGLTTNAMAWVLVWVPKDSAMGRATFSADLFSEEPVLLDAFTSVLGARRFFAAADGDRLEQLLEESASAQADVTGKLGQQVRQAVELLVGAISRADRDREGELLAGIEPHQVYEAAVSVLMRCVFLLYAEERGLLPLGDDLYDESLAVSTLLDQLREVADLAGDEPLERSNSAWYRLLALFRAVHGGIGHDRLRIPAYGGGLFDPDRFPFLEGRRPGEQWRDTPSIPLPVDDLTVLAMLTALQELRFTEVGVTETRRLTYRSLDVEQIGHVYEGLLDHSAIAVDHTAVGLVGKVGNEPEVSLEELTAAAAKGRDDFVGWLTDTTGRTARQIERLLNADADANTLRLLRAACDNDEVLTAHLTPYVHLLRPNLRGLPTVFPRGSMYVTQIGANRDTGTAYTTRDLAEEVVKRALEPLVYDPGPADGAEHDAWKLRSSAELLELKVCDPAVGSGAILVAACRYLAGRLVEAWECEDAPEAVGDPDEVTTMALRTVADRCIYGVDRNPMAVEMAKVSLWLVTLSRDRPFTFLDHVLKAGDSLLGITSLDQLRHLHLDPAIGQRRQLAIGESPAVIDAAVERAVDLRCQLEAIPVVTIQDSEGKARLEVEATDGLRALRIVADLVVGCSLRAEIPGHPSAEDQLAAEGALVAAALDPRQPPEIRGLALGQVEERACLALNAGRPDSAPCRNPLHWPLAFPEVFVEDRKGFDAFVGNPPFLGGTKISGPMGTDIRGYLATRIARRKTDRADLVCFFFLRAADLLSTNGGLGFIATRSVAESVSREVALDEIVRRGFVIHAARSSLPWPGASAVTVCIVWAHRPWQGEFRLDGEIGGSPITTSLQSASRVTGVPIALVANSGRCLGGVKPGSEAFVLTAANLKTYSVTHPETFDCISPYLGGDDLYDSPTQAPSRWLLDFSEEPNDWHWQALGPALERLRAARGDDPAWWRHSRAAKQLRGLLKAHPKVTLCWVEVSKTLAPELVDLTRTVPSNKVVCVPESNWNEFGVLSSEFHRLWTFQWAQTQGGSPSYTPSTVFDPFPQPSPSPGVAAAAEILQKYRQKLMQDNIEGLTKTYNRVNNETDDSPGIGVLRNLHVDLDLVVRDAYSWTDLDLGHGFHDTPQGRRFTVNPRVRIEVLDRLLELNHRRYADEVAAGLHEKKTKGRGRARRQVPEADMPRLL